MTTRGVQGTTPAPDLSQALHQYLLEATAGPAIDELMEEPEKSAPATSGDPRLRTFSSERMRANLFIQLADYDVSFVDGLAVNRAWAEVFTRLAKRDLSAVDTNRQRDLSVVGYPQFLTPYEAPGEMVLRKWCKNAARVVEIARRGYLEAAHSGLNRYENFIPSVQYPDLTGVMLADPAADPNDIGWHDLSRHYIDVVFEGAAILHTFHRQKFIAPLPARIRDSAWENAVRSVQYMPFSSELDSELMRMVRRQVPKAPVIPLRFARIAGSSIGGFVESPQGAPEGSVRGNGGGSAARAAFTSIASALAVHAAALRPTFRPAFVPANPALAGVR